MFKHMFSSMHQLLDEVAEQYPSASGEEKDQLNEQMELLKSMSDAFIEEWLTFEEKLGQVKAQMHHSSDSMESSPLPNKQHAAPPTIEYLDKGASKEVQSVSFSRAQGYYQLMMYREAIQELQQVIWQYPEHMTARLYLAMCYMQVDETSEAFRHFQFIIPLTDDSTIKAIAYNALGCLQVKDQNLERAREMFRLAHETDPTLAEPMLNMEICKLNQEMLTAGFEVIPDYS